jgi:hypothetical protein
MTNDKRREEVVATALRVHEQGGMSLADQFRVVFSYGLDAGAAHADSGETIATSFMEPATDEWPKRVHLCNAQSHFIVKPKGKKVWGCDREYVDAQALAEVRAWRDKVRPVEEPFSKEYADELDAILRKAEGSSDE